MQLISISRSACFSASVVSFWPDSMRPISRVRAAASSSSIGSHGAPFLFVLLHHVVMIGEAGDLRQVRHAQHLVRRRQLLQPPPDAFGHAAADAGVHFIEHQGAHRAAARARAPPARLQRQRDARDLAAGSDLFDGLRLFAQIRRHQKFDRIFAGRRCIRRDAPRSEKPPAPWPATPVPLPRACRALPAASLRRAVRLAASASYCSLNFPRSARSASIRSPACSTASMLRATCAR